MSVSEWMLFVLHQVIQIVHIYHGRSKLLVEPLHANLYTYETMLYCNKWNNTYIYIDVNLIPRRKIIFFLNE
jgi:hypothetical protein